MIFRRRSKRIFSRVFLRFICIFAVYINLFYLELYQDQESIFEKQE